MADRSGPSENSFFSIERINMSTRKPAQPGTDPTNTIYSNNQVLLRAGGELLGDSGLGGQPTLHLEILVEIRDWI